MTKSIEGVFLRLDPEQARTFWDAVAEAGYEQNADGATRLVLDLLEGVPENAETGDLGDRVARFIRENPEQVAAMQQGAAALARGIGNRIFV